MTYAHSVMGIQDYSSMAGGRSLLLVPSLAMAAGICEFILHKHLFASVPWIILDVVSGLWLAQANGLQDNSL